MRRGLDPAMCADPPGPAAGSHPGPKPAPGAPGGAPQPGVAGAAAGDAHPAWHRFDRRFRAGDIETRAILAEVCARLAAAGLDEDQVGTVELVLAEVLNNITEHAYGPEGGPVALGLDLPTGAVLCEVIDEGQPMPHQQVPAPGLPSIAPPDHLPEGGFGWHIVRCLVADLHYDRHEGRNRLRLRVPL
jgi:serine/threonine-protein kinase RsbW